MPTILANRQDWLFLSVLWLLSIFAMLFAAADLDTGRDVYWAWQIASGAEYPLEGPPLAGAIHAGPIWYYVLAFFLSLHPSWLAVTLGVAVLQGLKIPLAYQCGKLFLDRRFGLLWACMICLPGWTAMNYLVFTHPTLVETTQLAAFFMLLRWHQTGSANWFYGFAIMFCVALNAHPTNAIIAAVALPLILAGMRKGLLSAKTLLIATGAFLLPVASYIIHQSLIAWPDLSTSGSYLSNQSVVQNLTGTPNLLAGILVDGFTVGLRSIAGVSDNIILVLAAVTSVFLAIAIMGLLRGSLNGRYRQQILYSLYATFIAILIVAAIREKTPYYMSFALYPILSGLVALGLYFTVVLSHRIVLRCTQVFAILLLCLNAQGMYTISKEGKIEVPVGMTDLRLRTLDQTITGTHFPNIERKGLGEKICAEIPITLHGAAAMFAESGYANSARFACNLAQQDIRFGGGGNFGHWLGMSTNTRKILALSPGDQRSSLEFFKVMVHHPAHAYEPVDPSRYPLHEFLAAENQLFQHKLNLRPNDLLVVVNTAHFWMPGTFEVKLNGRIQPAALIDLAANYFRAEATPTDQNVNEWQITIRAPDPSRFEILSLKDRGKAFQ